MHPRSKKTALLEQAPHSSSIMVSRMFGSVSGTLEVESLGEEPDATGCGSFSTPGLKVTMRVWELESRSKEEKCTGSAAVVLLLSFARLFSLVEHHALPAWHCACTFSLIEGFAGDDTIDLLGGVRFASSDWKISSENWLYKPVKIFWNASSTLLASRADVSMKERLLSAMKSVSISESNTTEWIEAYLRIPLLLLLARLGDASNRSCCPRA